MSSDHIKNSKASVVVLGAGLAGMSAALRLAKAHVPCRVIESRPQPGGRAMSFQHQDAQLDNCQHVLMRCCTQLIAFYESLGVIDQIEWHDRFYFISKGGMQDELAGDDLPAPAHMAMSLFKFKCLNWREKLAISYAMGILIHTDRWSWRNRSFADWLKFVKQPQSAIDKYWEPVCISAINEPSELAAADLTMQVFQEGFMRHEKAYEMGLSKVPLSQLYEPLAQKLNDAGSEIRFGCSALGITFDRSEKVIQQVKVNDRKGAGEQTLDVTHVISAVPFDRTLKLATDDMQAVDARYQHLGEMSVSPIAGIHIWLKTNADGSCKFDLPHASLVKSPLHWLFHKGVTNWQGQSAQLLNAVISASRNLIGLSSDEIRQMLSEELTSFFPQILDSDILDLKVVIEKRATFSAGPGFSDLRPKTRGEIANLYFAGDYCQSGWPATMEGAVRSGNYAAIALLEDLGFSPDHPAMQLAPEHERGGLATILPQL